MEFVTYAVHCGNVVVPAGETDIPGLDLRISHRPAGEIDEFWERELGHIFARRFMSANLHIYALAQEDRPEPRSLRTQISHAFYAMWLHGMLGITSADGMSGTRTDGIWSATGSLEVKIPTREQWPLREVVLAAETLTSVGRVTQGLIERDRRLREFRRLWHGLHMVLRGLQEQVDSFERSACLIRSLEAIVFEPDIKGLGAKDFGQRGAAFLADRDATKLSACYTKLRNAALHMHDRQMIEKDPNAKKELDALGQLAESLTLHVWREILGRPEVLESVSDARLPELQARLKAGEAGAWLGAGFEPPKPPA